MSIERCTQCEKSVDMDWNAGEYLNDKFYCEGCIDVRQCPNCNIIDNLSVYKYDHGGKHVECNNCFYLGPCASTVKDAIKEHNALVKAKSVKI